MNGIGLPRDPVAAFRWFELAATPQGIDQNEGDQVAAQAASGRGRLAAQMTPAQIEEARQQALAFRPKRS